MGSGLGRYTPASLEWFRIFSLNPRPKYVWDRSDLAYVDRRDAGGVEQLSLYPDHVVIRCTTSEGDLESAEARRGAMGFQAWLEASLPSAVQHLVTTTPTAPYLRARNAVVTAFVLNGLVFATLFSRVPDLAVSGLDLTNGQLGLLLLSISSGRCSGCPRAG